ncbi:MAG: alpha/beta hydrolase [Corynebacterium sp.]|nr:alpha/beta hydrolase [Corynebacterium sp.]
MRFFQHPAPTPPQTVAFEGAFTHEYVYARGLRLHVALSTENAHDTSAPLVILLHDSFGAWFDYMDVIGPLAAAGYRVAALDLRGVGLSDKPPSGYDIRRMVGDVVGAIGALGVSSAVVVGAGTGASVAWTLAANYPEHVDALVSIAGIHPLAFRRACILRPYAHYGTLTRALLCRLPFAETFPWMSSYAGLSHACSRGFIGSEAFKKAVARREAGVAVDKAYRAMVRTTRLEIGIMPIKWRASKVTCPVLAIGVTPYLLKCARANTTRPIEVAQVPRSHHAPYIENPRGTASAIADFLDSHL